ncbi:hypothetical protein C4577_05155 [Candidatus Parcubacteria bacterium]|nr:MAG: hypothetical protein C4577_05155 [Candidatus Parcubacteria bacterium]
MNKPECSGCNDQLGWYSPDNGQWVSCKCSGNRKAGYEIPDFIIDCDELASCDQCNEDKPSIRLAFMHICENCLERAQRAFDCWGMLMSEVEAEHEKG